MNEGKPASSDGVVVGQLSRPGVDPAQWWAVAATAGKLLSADCRCGSNGQWFAVVLDEDREPLLTSEAFASRDAALAAAKDAVEAIRRVVAQSRDLSRTS